MLPSLDIQHITVEIGTLSLEIELPRDIDQVINYYAEHHAESADLIPYYAELWPSAVALAQYLLKLPQQLSGKSVIELGCGLGLPSLVAASRGAQVVATDFHPHNEQFIRRNIQLNNLTAVTYRTLDWKEPPCNLHGDLILGSDLLYEARNIQPLVKCAAALCATQGSIILADPGREHLQSAVLGLREFGFQETLHIVDDIFIIEFLKTHEKAGSQGHLPAQPCQASSQ